jgi:hypothetical protein
MVCDGKRRSSEPKMQLAPQIATFLPLSQMKALTITGEWVDNLGDGRPLHGLIWWLGGRFRSQAALHAEILVLRHKLMCRS